jgi:2-polyprenyl-6-methoxyphenol hydroxylase-like FAD-dependent oxidoreductase
MKRNGNQIHRMRAGQKAAVIGSGIAGLATAGVLAKYFEKVYVIDRDMLSDETAFRPGVPQAAHAHSLLPYGQLVLEELFPGIVDELLAAGAQVIDDNLDTGYYDGTVWRKPASKSSRPTVACSRPLLEGFLVRKIREVPQIEIYQGYEAAEIITDEQGSNIVGITIVNRQTAGEEPQHLPVDLLVDASGRNSKMPKWLETLGFTPPEEWRINAYGGYASRIYRQPAGTRPDWKKLYISPRPPDGTCGGIILPLEGNRWHVTLIGLAGDYPPTDEEGFLQFARSLPMPALYDAIRDAEPLSKITAFRNTANRVRRYENLPRYLEGLLVLGDAVYTMNPVYALGMTAALVSGQVLDEALKKWAARPELTGFSEAFQKQLAAGMTTLWQQAVSSDWRWPVTDISDNTEALYPQVALA